MRAPRIHIALFLLFGLLPLRGQAQSQPTLHAEWDSVGTPLGQQATIEMGDQLQLVLSLPGCDTRPASFPTLDALRQGQLQPLDIRFDTFYDAEQAVQRQFVTFTCFEPGRHALSHLEVQVLMDGTMQSLSLEDSLWLTVTDIVGVDTSSTDIRDLAAIRREPYTFWEIFRWILLGLLVAAAVLVTIWIVRRRRSHQPIITLPKPAPIPPERQALNDLESLRRRELWQQGQLKRYHTELTDIIRQFLRARHGIDSAEMTTEQTMEAYIACPEHTAEQVERLRQMLQTADLVKFAKAEPLPNEHDRSMSNAVAFVNATAEAQTQTDPKS